MRNTSFRLRIQNSRTLNLAVTTAHLIVACVIVAASLAPMVQIGVLVVIGASLAYQRRLQTPGDYWFHPDGRVRSFSFDSNSPVGADETNAAKTTALQGGRANNALFAAADGYTPFAHTEGVEPIFRDVDPASRLLGPLLVIYFLNASVRNSLILLPDSFRSLDDYRRLRIWLKWQGKGRPLHHDVESILRVQDRV